MMTSDNLDQQLRSMKLYMILELCVIAELATAVCISDKHMEQLDEDIVKTSFISSIISSDNNIEHRENY